MKKNYLLLFFCFSLFFIASVDAKSNECSDLLEQIELMGEFRAHKQRSLEKPIQAFISEYSLQVNFLPNLGTIAVYIYDEQGAIVYQQSVNTSAEQDVYIDITFLSSGEYTIMFVDSQGQYMQGDFEI
jgi:hypothetical protein